MGEKMSVLPELTTEEANATPAISCCATLAVRASASSRRRMFASLAPAANRGAKLATAKQNVGTVREIGDGVAKIEGLRRDVNEMLDFGNGITGIALNLEETEVGAIILGDYTEIKEGDEVRTTGRLLQVPVGKGCSAASSTCSASRSTARGRSRKRILSGGKNRAGHHQAQFGQPAGADRHHGH